MDFSKNSLRMRLHNIRPFIVPITEFIDIPVVAEISDLPAGCMCVFTLLVAIKFWSQLMQRKTSSALIEDQNKG